MAGTLKIQIPAGKIAVKMDRAWQEILAPLAEEILNDCNQYCKEDTGMLIASSLTHSVPKTGTLKWVTPYARRQYWEIQTAHTDVNPNASWKWCHAAKAENLSKWNKQAEVLLKGKL